MLKKSPSFVVSKNISELHLDFRYQNLLNEIKSRLKKAQLRAAIVVNHELIQFYWEIGKLILDRQQESSWGNKLFRSLAIDLENSFSNTKGFSKSNLYDMRAFAKHYPMSEFFQALPGKLTWSHHVVLVRMIDPESLNIKQWYAQKTVENTWSYRELRNQIKADLYGRQAVSNKTTNFKDRLPPETSQLAQDLLKDPYKFHFLTLGENAHEKDIQQGLLEHLQQFMMELGHGFSLFGTKYALLISGKRFEIDLLMYNTRLHCYVVVELKRGDFQPKDTGQLNFYLTAVDDYLRSVGDGPTVGLILCEKKDQVVAEYALQRIDSPIGIAEYQLSKTLPKKFQGILPTTQEIEAELSEKIFS